MEEIEHVLDVASDILDNAFRPSNYDCEVRIAGRGYDKEEAGVRAVLRGVSEREAAYFCGYIAGRLDWRGRGRVIREDDGFWLLLGRDPGSGWQWNDQMIGMRDVVSRKTL